MLYSAKERKSGRELCSRIDRIPNRVTNRLIASLLLGPAIVALIALGTFGLLKRHNHSAAATVMPALSCKDAEAMFLAKLKQERITLAYEHCNAGYPVSQYIWESQFTLRQVGTAQLYGAGFKWNPKTRTFHYLGLRPYKTPSIP